MPSNIPYILLIDLNCKLRTDKMTDERFKVSDIFRKQTFDAIKALRKDEKKRPGRKTIHSSITQHNTISLDESSVINTFKLLSKEHFLKNTPF